MKIKLTENIKIFISNLDNETRSKLIVTEDTVETENKDLENKLRDFARREFRANIHKKLEKSRKETEIFLKEHPEYLE